MFEQVQKYGQLSNVILVTRTRAVSVHVCVCVCVSELGVLFSIETCRFWKLRLAALHCIDLRVALREYMIWLY